MGTSLASLVLAISVASTGQLFHKKPGYILPDGPGNGWGFPNNQPDGYGWPYYGELLPLGANRTAEYFFPRNFSLPPIQLVPSTYYNPYVTRGQRFIAYAGCGGDHPAGGPPLGSAMTPTHPYNDVAGRQQVVPTPVFNGRSQAPPVPSGGSGLIP